MKRPPLPVVLVALLLLALGETAGAAMSQLRAPLERWSSARVDANRAVHGLSGSAEYDDEVRARTIFLVEAGLSFLHTHAEGLGLVLFFTSTLVASAVGGRRWRGLLYPPLTVGALFPVGYLVYSVAVLELGRDAGVEFAERWVLTALGGLAILGLLGLGAALAAGRGRV
ncbi:MAG: hypothetical protein HY615_14600 [Candidatus Rokubacteria bacterium]|nr:hypothetical protein [Candidatus Rokubacteria bacterium]